MLTPNPTPWQKHSISLSFSAGPPHGASARAADAYELFDSWSRAQLNFLVTAARVTLRLSITHLSDLTPTQRSELHYSNVTQWVLVCYLHEPLHPHPPSARGKCRRHSGEQCISTPLFAQLVLSHKLIQDLTRFHFLSQSQENLDWIKILYVFQTLIDLLSVPNCVEGN